MMNGPSSLTLERRMDELTLDSGRVFISASTELEIVPQAG